MNSEVASSSTQPLVLPLSAELVTRDQILAQEAIAKDRLIAEAATLQAGVQAGVQAKAAKLNEDQESRRIEAALRNEPQAPLPQDNKTQVDTPTKQVSEDPLESLKRELEDQKDQMTDDQSEDDARRVRTKA